MAKKFTVTVPISDFTNLNPVYKKIRVEKLSLKIVLLWLGRHIIRDYYIDSEWFGGSETETDYVFWFKLKTDADAADLFLKDLIKNGIPKIKV
jgi:hypothetical protein